MECNSTKLALHPTLSGQKFFKRNRRGLKIILQETQKSQVNKKVVFEIPDRDTEGPDADHNLTVNCL